jgi:hypothetical protein
MIGSAAAAAVYGGVLGALSGGVSRWALGRVLNSSETIFYSVFVGGVFCRLLVLTAAVCLLRHEKYIIIISFAASLILVQMVFEAFPLKHNGIKRNS